MMTQTKCWALEFSVLEKLRQEKPKTLERKFHFPHVRSQRREHLCRSELRRGCSKPLRRLLLKDSKKLDFFMQSAINRWLTEHPALAEIYRAKEALHRLYRIKGYHRAKQALLNLLDMLGRSKVPEILTFRRTLLSWRKEILEYFRTKLTNGRVEGYNNKAKLIRKRGRV